MTGPYKFLQNKEMFIAMNNPEQLAKFEQKIDPQLRELLRATPDLLHDLPTLREIQARVSDYLVEYGDNIKHSTEVLIYDWEVPATQTSVAVRIRCYEPKGYQPQTGKQDKPLPVLLWIHGGGFISGDVKSNDNICENFVVECNCIVVSVEYRLTPQHPYPAGFNDCYAVLEWLASKGAAELDIDGDRIAVGGSSVGGCLAAGIALKACETDGPKIKHQLLLIPVLDDRHITQSSRDITDHRVVWNRDLSMLAWDGYLHDVFGETPSYAAPARTKTIPNLPSTFISVEEQDILRDESIVYAQRLMQAGVNTELHVYPGTFHGSFMDVPGADVSKQHMADVFNSLKKALNQHNDESVLYKTAETDA